jgi:hypothetical protein
MNPYLKSFIIGSSFPSFILYFLAVRFTKKNYHFEDYALICPLALGIDNMLSLYIAKKYNLSLRTRMLGSSIFFSLFVFIFDYYTNQYNITSNEDWLTLYLIIFSIYFIVFNFIIYNLERML